MYWLYFTAFLDFAWMPLQWRDGRSAGAFLGAHGLESLGFAEIVALRVDGNGGMLLTLTGPSLEGRSGEVCTSQL